MQIFVQFGRNININSESRTPSKQLYKPRFLPNLFYRLSMVLVDRWPLLSCAGQSQLLMNEITARAVAAVPSFLEGVAAFGFVGAIGLHIDA